MSQDELRLPYLNMQGALAKYVRWLHYKLSPWVILAIASLELLFASSVRRTHAEISWMGAISRIDFAGIYGLLNDLLW